jgi:hypothetical protein
MSDTIQGRIVAEDYRREQFCNVIFQKLDGTTVSLDMRAGATQNNYRRIRYAKKDGLYVTVITEYVPHPVLRFLVHQS